MSRPSKLCRERDTTFSRLFSTSTVREIYLARFYNLRKLLYFVVKFHNFKILTLSFYSTEFLGWSALWLPPRVTSYLKAKALWKDWKKSRRWHSLFFEGKHSAFPLYRAQTKARTRAKPLARMRPVGNLWPFTDHTDKTNVNHLLWRWIDK